MFGMAAQWIACSAFRFYERTILNRIGFVALMQEQILQATSVRHTETVAQKNIAAGARLFGRVEMTKLAPEPLPFCG